LTDKFFSVGKQSFTDMGAYSVVVGLVSVSFPYDFENRNLTSPKSKFA
jgi:hypothetical protein